jgi:hypothetical protein
MVSCRIPSRPNLRGRCAGALVVGAKDGAALDRERLGELLADVPSDGSAHFRNLSVPPAAARLHFIGRLDDVAPTAGNISGVSA